jgi:hypothetical protein
MSQQTLFRNFELLEPAFGELRGGYELLIEGGLMSLEIWQRHGIPVVYGTDLLGELHSDQSKESSSANQRVCCRGERTYRGHGATAPSWPLH